MEVKKIQFVTEIENIYDDSVDVIVTLDNDFSYVIDVVTPQYLLSLMEENNQPFIGPGENYIIVRKLTSEVIEEAVKAFVEENDAYWLKLHHFASDVDMEVFNKLQVEQIEEFKRLDELDELDNFLN